jgi:hypothetical protein
VHYQTLAHSAISLLVLVNAGGCASLNKPDIVLNPATVPGCFSLIWESRPPGWRGPPVVDTLRIGPEGAATQGLDSVPALAKLKYIEWAIWRTHADTLIVYRPGDGIPAIHIALFQTHFGFAGEWSMRGGYRGEQPWRGNVSFYRLPCP